MGLTPLDIHNKEFKTTLFGGYKRDAVEDFLDQVIQEFELLIRENTHLTEQVENLKHKLDQYRSLEETINKTLIVAQEASEDIKHNARKEADLIIQEARIQAERIIEAGQARSRRIEEESAELSRTIQVLRMQVKALLQAQISALESLHDPFAQAAPSSQAPEQEWDGRF